MEQNSEEEFDSKYHPVKNHMDGNAAYDGCMFETFGDEIQYVLSINKTAPKKVWTIIDNNDGWTGICAGYHIVNRLGYMITEEEWKDDGETYTFYDEGPVNDWFQETSTDIFAKIFPEYALELPHNIYYEDLDEDLQDKLLSQWHEKSLDEREEFMNKYKELELKP